MRKRILFFLLVLAGNFFPAGAQLPQLSLPAGSPDGLHLVPRPSSVKRQPGLYRLSGRAGVGFTTDSLRSAAIRAGTLIFPAASPQLTCKRSPAGGLVLEIFAPADSRLGSEGYRLTVAASGIRISGNTVRAVSHGITTLGQLAGQASGPVENRLVFPRVQIEDIPRFPYRGMMLDVSRHFFTVPEVKRYMEGLARFKINILHLHLTDDQGWRLEVPAYPRLTTVGAWRVPRYGAFGTDSRRPPEPGEKATYGGFYSAADIRELVRHGQALGIQIVPEIDVPGHCMAALAAYPRLGCTRDTSIRVNPGSRFSDWFSNGTFRMNVENSLNPSDEEVYVFLDSVFAQVARLFPAPWIHAGGDECYTGYWKKDSACLALMEKLGLRHAEDLQGWFMGRVKKLVEKHGKTLIGWDEIAEGPVDSSVTLMFWRGWKSRELAPVLARTGCDILLSPTQTSYFDYYQGEKMLEPVVYAGLRFRDVYGFRPVLAGVPAGRIKGGQANLWTEQVQTYRHAEYMTFPRLLAISARLWEKENETSWESWFPSAYRHMQRLEKDGFRVSHAVLDPVLSAKTDKGRRLVVLGSEVPGAEIRYTIDESMPDNRSPLYREAFGVPEGAVTLRVQAFHSGRPVGNLLVFPPEVLRNRMKP